jgi:hypothetical protein
MKVFRLILLYVGLFLPILQSAHAVVDDVDVDWRADDQVSERRVDALSDLLAQTMDQYIDSIGEADGISHAEVTLKMYRRQYFGAGSYFSGSSTGAHGFVMRIAGDVELYDDTDQLVKRYRNVDAIIRQGNKPQPVAYDTIDDLDRQMIYAFVGQLNRERIKKRF